MSDAMDKTKEAIEELRDPWARRMAVLISALAAVLALSEIGGKAAQNAYLTDHVSLSNDWAFYQAKNLRAIVRSSEADLLASLPNAADPAVQGRIKDAEAYNTRMRDDPGSGEGMKQIAERARALEVLRDKAEHRYHSYEYVVGALEIAIVLASVSVVTRMRGLGIGAAAIGAIATAASLCIAANVF